MPIPKVLKDLLTLPTASFREDAVLHYIRAAVEKLDSTSLKEDRWGNLLVRYVRGARGKGAPPALVFSAHTDHPSFVVVEDLGRARGRSGTAGKFRVRAEFRGGVRPSYFIDGKVRFWTEDGVVRGKIVDPGAQSEPRVRPRIADPRKVVIETSKPVALDAIGMWDLPDPVEKDGLVYARACDDIQGVAAMLALLQKLAKRRAQADVYCLFTRAEEVGFVGAIAAARDRLVPKKLPIIAIEASSAAAGAPIGAGPVLRIGDRMSIFSQPLSDFVERVAREKMKRSKKFQYQRKLMDGGTCETTAFLAYGYEATGICVSLGNYHNMDTKRGKIGSEYISLNDWKLMVEWFEALVLDKEGPGTSDTRLRQTMEARFAHFAGQL